MKPRIKILVAVVALASVLAGWLVMCVTPPPLPRPEASNFLLQDVTVINPMVDRIERATLRVEGDRLKLAATDPQDFEPLPSLDAYRGHFVLPGFIDMHTHLATDNLLDLTAHYGLLNLAYGVTTIRDAGDVDGTATPVGRQAIADGAPFPRLISCGPFVSRGVSVWPNTVELDDPADAAELVAGLAADGYGCIKAYEGLTPELTHALVVAAADHGLHVIGHVPVEYTLEESGIPDVQHLFGVPRPESLGGDSVLFRNGDWADVSEERLLEVSQFILEHQIRNTPTLVTLEGLLGLGDHASAAAESARSLPAFFADVVWHPDKGLPVYRALPPEQLEAAEVALRAKKALVKRLSDAGAILHLGTDVGQPFSAPGVSYWREMHLFADAGIAPEQVLAYATHVAARSLDVDTGVLADGRPADLLIFAEDPTRDLQALDSLVAVVRRGELYTKADLDAAVQQRLAHYDAWPLRALASRAAQDFVDRAAKNF